MQNVNENVKLKTSEQMIKDAGLDWKVRQAPVLFEGNGLKTVPGKLVNFRDDNGAALGIVSPSYKIVQNSTAFAFLDSFLGDAIESYEKAGSYDGGAKVYMRVKLPGDLVFANNPDDKGIKYVDFFTSHDGSIATTASLVAWRQVCSNGLMGFKKIAGGSIKHTLNASLETLRRSLGLLNQQFDIIQSLSNKMAEQPFSVNKMGEVLEKVGLIPAEEKRSTRAANILDEVSRLFDGHGKGSTFNGSKGTVWGAYNAVTEYVDHYRGTDERREQSAYIGSGATIKEKALELLAV